MRLALAAILGLAVACSGAERAGPHVVLVTIDTLRVDHLGIYGYSRDTSPNIDAFFSGATVFENAASSAPCTIPSVSQYLAGAFDYDSERKVLAELLRDRGYRTAAVVSQHNLRQALDLYRRGFDHFDIQGEDEVDWRNVTTRRADVVTDRALAWLGENRDSDRIFLWVHYFDPHDPYDPPGAFRDLDTGSDKHGDLYRYRQDSGKTDDEIFEAEDIEHFRSLYDGEIRFADAEIGRLLAGLEAAGVAENAIVALSADHGEELWERGRWGHCSSLHDAQVHVPLLLRVNGHPLAGRQRVAESVSTLDLLPTVMGLLGFELAAAEYHGVDLRAVPPGRAVASMWSGELAVRDAEWKLVLRDGVPSGLYWIAKDHEERWNRLADRPEPQARLLEQAAPFVAVHRNLHLEHIEHVLRKIGYIE